MVKTKEELLEFLKERFKDSTEDDVLAFLEDLSDTIDDMTARMSDETDWKTKFEENDKAWREKYRDRFYSAPKEDVDVDFIEPDTSDEKTYTYDDLFDDGKEKK